MKIALYIENGVEQIVLTPDGEFERSLLAKLDAKDRVLTIKHGSFFETNGGWIRHDDGDRSTMIVLRRADTQS